mgnify:CR=1 FL=1
MPEKSNKSFVIKLALILFAITFIATLLLTLCNYITKDKIALLEAQNAENARQSVISGANFKKVDLDESLLKEHASCGTIEAYRADKNGEFAGYCISVAPTGYIGQINMIVGINPDLSFAGIKIISMSETPGLGAKATNKEFYGQFSEGKKGTLSVVKNQPAPKENEINAVTGATITSKTITKGANCALEIATYLNESEAE